MCDGSNGFCSGGTCYCTLGWDDCDGDQTCECNTGMMMHCEAGSCVPD